MWHRKKFEDKFKEKTIFSIDQLEEKREPRSIFLPYYKLGKLDTYYRRGDNPVYTGNFIPVWQYPLFLDKVIMYLPPFRSNNEVFNYCGASLEEILKLIKADLLVPIVGNNFENYEKEIFNKFIKNLPDDKPLIRAQLFEDALLGDNFAFQRDVQNISEGYQLQINKFDKLAIDEYLQERQKNPLIPDLNRLSPFIAERAKWQELFGLKENVNTIENSLNNSPLVAYRTARTLHYVVAPRLYSRGGFTMMAYNDDLQFTDEGGKILAPAFPFGSKESEIIRTSAPIIQLPMRKWEVKQAIDLVIDIRNHDRKVDDEEKNVRSDITEVMNNLWDTYSFQTEPLEKYEENTNDLKNSFKMFTEKLLEFQKEKQINREILKTFSGSITSIPSAMHDRDLRTLINSIEELIEKAELITSPHKIIFKSIFLLSIKAGLVRKDDPRIEEEVINQMRKLQGMVELWGEKEKIQTPILMVRYNNPT